MLNNQYWQIRNNAKNQTMFICRVMLHQLVWMTFPEKSFQVWKDFTHSLDCISFCKYVLRVLHSQPVTWNSQGSRPTLCHVSVSQTSWEEAAWGSPGPTSKNLRSYTGLPLSHCVIDRTEGLPPLCVCVCLGSWHCGKTGWGETGRGKICTFFPLRSLQHHLVVDSGTVRLLKKDYSWGWVWMFMVYPTPSCA